jgi:hypothetical protein
MGHASATAAVVAGRGSRRLSCEVAYGGLDLLCLDRLLLTAPPRALRSMSGDGKRSAGRRPQAIAPILDST